MKVILAISLFLSVSAYANSSEYFEGILDEVCADRVVDREKDILFCKADNSSKVLGAKVGSALKTREYNRLGFHTYSAVDIGLVPDADSNTAYFYTRWLVNSAGQKVGVITIEGWYNTEMELADRFDIRYNLKGQVVSIEVKPIR